MSAPLAEGAQSRASERTLDKRGGSKGKTSWEFLFWTERGVTKEGNDRGERGMLQRGYSFPLSVCVKVHNTNTNATIISVSFTLTPICASFFSSL